MSVGLMSAPRATVARRLVASLAALLLAGCVGSVTSAPSTSIEASSAVVDRVRLDPLEPNGTPALDSGQPYACTLVGAERTAAVVLAATPGARTLLEVTQGTPVPVLSMAPRRLSGRSSRA